MTGPIVVTALFGADDFAMLEELRRRHYPAAHNRVPAHLTLFRHLPPGVEAELRRRLSAETRGRPAPRAWLAGVLDLGGGVALRVESPELEAIRDALAEALSPLLMPQDRAGWRPHVTIQNKVAPREARALKSTLETVLRRQPLRIAGLATWRYRDGRWDPLSRHSFGA